MSRTTSENYEEFTSPNANLPVKTLIPACCRSTPTTGLHTREKNEANTDCSSMTSGQTNTGPLTDTVEAFETTMEPRLSG